VEAKLISPPSYMSTCMLYGESSVCGFTAVEAV